MFKNTDKQKLYWLIDEYLSKRVTARTFCDEFYYCFDLGLDMSLLSDVELAAFLDLSNVKSRFSWSREDIEQYPGVFYSESELHDKIVETKARLFEESHF